MKARSEAQQRRLNMLLNAGWQIVEEYPLLRLITLARPVHDCGVTRFEHITLARDGKTTLEKKA